MGEYKVACCSYNLGQKQPDAAAFSAWLADAAHADIVAIGVQEGHYRVAGASCDEGGQGAAREGPWHFEWKSIAGIAGAGLGATIGGALLLSVPVLAVVAAGAGGAAGYLGATAVADEIACREDITRGCTAALGPGFELVASETLLQMRLMVFVRSAVRDDVRLESTASVPMGYLNAFGNKGALMAVLAVRGRRLALVSGHLEAHAGHLPRRVAQAKTLVKTFDAATNGALRDGATEVLLFGDLNFRLDTSRLPAAPPSAPPPPEGCPPKLHAAWPSVVEHVRSGRLDALLGADELSAELAAGRIFPGLQESAITFAPTYKFLTAKKGGGAGATDGPRYVAKRLPAWTDRVLYGRFAPAAKDGGAGDDETAGLLSSDMAVQDAAQQTALRPGAYRSVATGPSDHWPVVASFTLGVDR